MSRNNGERIIIYLWSEISVHVLNPPVGAVILKFIPRADFFFKKKKHNTKKIHLRMSLCEIISIADSSHFAFLANLIQIDITQLVPCKIQNRF